MTETDWLDGPGLVEWLEAQRPKRDLGDYGPVGKLSKRIREWRAGDKANVYVVDSVLVSLGLTIAYVPTELYVEPPQTGKPKLTAAQRAAIKVEAAVPRGYRSQTYRQIANRYGVSERRVRQIVTGH